MNGFLANLVLRGAGLPVATAIEAPPASPFGPLSRREGDDLPEMVSTAPPGPDPRVAGTSGLTVTGSSPEAAPAAFSDRSTAGPAVVQRFSETLSAMPPPYRNPEAVSVVPGISRADPAPPAFPRVEAPDSPSPVVAEPSMRMPPDPRVSERGIGQPEVGSRPDARSRPSSRDIEKPGRSKFPAAHSIIAAVDEAAMPVSVSPEIPNAVTGVTAAVEDSEPATRPSAEPEPSVVTLRPAPDPALVRFPKSAPSSRQTPPATPLPIHVHIGQVEVRAAPPSAPAPARPEPPAQVGFAGYERIRTYRS